MQIGTVLLNTITGEVVAFVDTDTVYSEATLKPEIVSRWMSPDPLADEFPSWSPYNFINNNPILYIDPDGLAPFSTHTDEDGNVIAVYDDDDLGVYTHANGTTKEDLDSRHNAMVLKNPTGAGGQKVGETEYWDEFRDHDNTTGEVLSSVQEDARIAFGESWGETISSLNEKAQNMNLKEIANNSRSNQLFDIKTNKEYAPYGAGTGKLLNGKYATARSAGNYLAGYNAQGGTYFGKSVSKTTFMKMAGALHTGNWSRSNAIGIMLKGTSYGPAPYYGEIPYAGRMIDAGWKAETK